MVEVMMAQGGADHEIKDKDLNKAIHFASEFSALDCIKHLITHGVNVNPCNRSGLTPFDMAGNDETRELLAASGG